MTVNPKSDSEGFNPSFQERFFVDTKQFNSIIRFNLVNLFVNYYHRNQLISLFHFSRILFEFIRQWYMVKCFLIH